MSRFPFIMQNWYICYSAGPVSPACKTIRKLFKTMRSLHRIQEKDLSSALTAFSCRDPRRTVQIFSGRALIFGKVKAPRFGEGFLRSKVIGAEFQPAQIIKY